ncbi:hypothetical protein CLU79DRAFT_689509, partial [Phycomyces nitens]
IGQNESVVETIATHSEYSRHAACSQCFLTCSILAEKSKDKDALLRKPIITQSYICYTVQDKARLFN